MSLQTLPEQFLYTRLSDGLIDEDKRGILEAICGGFQDRLEDVRSAIQQYEIVLDSPNPVTKNNSIAVTYQGRGPKGTLTRQLNVNVLDGVKSTPRGQIKSSTVYLIIGGKSVVYDEVSYLTGQEFTGEVGILSYSTETGKELVYEKSALYRYLAELLVIDEQAIRKVEITTDNLRVVDLNTLQYLASTLGAVLYKNPALDSVTLLEEQRKVLVGYFPRLQLKGTNRSFEILGKTVGFDDVKLTPLWGRVSPRRPDDIGDIANDKDFSSSPEHEPSTVISPYYNPNELNDGAFYVWKSAVISKVREDSNFYNNVVNGNNPFVEVITGTQETIVHPAAGVYYLRNGSPGKRSEVEIPNTGLIFRAIADGPSFNGCPIEVSVAPNDTVTLSIRWRLSSIKYRTSYYNLSLAIDLDKFRQSFGDVAVTKNSDIEVNPDGHQELDGEGQLVTPSAPYHPWTGGRLEDGVVVERVQAPNTADQINVEKLTALATQSSHYFDDVRTATRYPRQLGFGFSVKDDINFAPFPNRTQLFVATSPTTHTGTVTRNLDIPYTSIIALELTKEQFATRTSTTQPFRCKASGIPAIPGTVEIVYDGDVVTTDDEHGLISSATIEVDSVEYEITGEIDYATGELVITASQDLPLFQLGYNYHYYNPLTGERDTAPESNLINYTGDMIEGWFNFDTGAWSFTDNGLDTGTPVVALWLLTSTDYLGLEPSDGLKDGSLVDFQRRPEDEQDTPDGYQYGTFDDQPFRRGVVAGGQVLDKDTIDIDFLSSKDMGEVMTVVDHHGIEYDIFGVDATSENPQLPIRVKISERDYSASNYAPGQDAVAIRDSDFYNVGLVQGVLVADPTAFFNSAHRKGLVGWLSFNEHPSDDLTFNDRSSVGSFQEVVGLTEDNRAWDDDRGWYTVMSEGVNSYTKAYRPIDNEFSMSFWIMPGPEQDTGSQTFFSYGPLSIEISNSGTNATLQFLWKSSSGTLSAGSVSVPPDVFSFIAYRRKGEHVSIAIGDLSTEISDTMDDTITGSFDNFTTLDDSLVFMGSKRRFGLHDLRIWNVFKTPSDFNAVRAYPFKKTIVNYVPTYFKTLGNRSPWGLKVLSTGLVFPEALPVNFTSSFFSAYSSEGLTVPSVASGSLTVGKQYEVDEAKSIVHDGRTYEAGDIFTAVSTAYTGDSNAVHQVRMLIRQSLTRAVNYDSEGRYQGEQRLKETGLGGGQWPEDLVWKLGQRFFSLPGTGHTVVTGSGIPLDQSPNSPDGMSLIHTYEPAGALPQLDPPTFSPEDGAEVEFPVNVTLSHALEGEPGFEIRYEIDGTPTLASPIYSGPIAITSDAQVLSAYARKPDTHLDSNIESAQYVEETPTTQVDDPFFDPTESTEQSFPLLVTIDHSDFANVTIRYTIDGSNPSATNGIVYEGEDIEITGTDIVLKARAFKTGFSPSDVVSGSWDPADILDPPTINPPDGTEVESFPVSATISHPLFGVPGFTIEYSIVGPFVNVSGPYNGGALSIIDEDTVLSAYATKPSTHQDSTTETAQYAVGDELPQLEVPSVIPHNYNNENTGSGTPRFSSYVILRHPLEDETGFDIKYRVVTPGSSPPAFSTYSSIPILLTVQQRLEAFATKPLTNVDSSTISFTPWRSTNVDLAYFGVASDHVSPTSITTDAAGDYCWKITVSNLNKEADLKMVEIWHLHTQGEWDGLNVWSTTATVQPESDGELTKAQTRWTGHTSGETFTPRPLAICDESRQVISVLNSGARSTLLRLQPKYTYTFYAYGSQITGTPRYFQVRLHLQPVTGGGTTTTDWHTQAIISPTTHVETLTRAHSITWQALSTSSVKFMYTPPAYPAGTDANHLYFKYLPYSATAGTGHASTSIGSTSTEYTFNAGNDDTYHSVFLQAAAQFPSITTNGEFSEFFRIKPLPRPVGSLTAQVVDQNAIRLSWVPVSPIDVSAGDYFHVQRSTNSSGPWEDNAVSSIDHVTPDVKSNATSWFLGGATFQAGKYRIFYTSGAMKYNPGLGFSVQDPLVQGNGFKIVYSGGEVTSPGDRTQFSTEQNCVLHNSGRYVDISHNGGKIGIYLKDNPYGDNSGSVTFRLESISLHPVVVAVVIPSYLDTSCSRNTTYYYRVRQKNVGGFSAWSPVISSASQVGLPNYVYYTTDSRISNFNYWGKDYDALGGGTYGTTSDNMAEHHFSFDISCGNSEQTISKVEIYWLQNGTWGGEVISTKSPVFPAVHFKWAYTNGTLHPTSESYLSNPAKIRFDHNGLNQEDVVNSCLPITINSPWPANGHNTTIVVPSGNHTIHLHGKLPAASYSPLANDTYVLCVTFADGGVCRTTRKDKVSPYLAAVPLAEVYENSVVTDSELHVRKVSTSSVVLDWYTQLGPGVVTFDVERKIVWYDNEYKEVEAWKKIGTVNVEADLGPRYQSYEDSTFGSLPGGDYRIMHYRVRAYNANSGYGNYSNVVKIRPRNQLEYTINNAANSDKDKYLTTAELRWPNYAETANTTWKVEERLQLVGTWVEIASLSPKTVEHSEGSVTRNSFSYSVELKDMSQSHDFRVKPVGGSYSNTVTVTPSQMPT